MKGERMGKRSNGTLTGPQRKALDYILKCVEQEHRTPTIRQLGAKMGQRSTGSTRDVIAALVRKGHLIKDAALSRGIRLNPRKYKVQVTAKR